MPSPEKFKKSLEQFGIDPEVSARIGQGYEDICDRSPKKTRAAYFKRAVDIMAENVDAETLQAVLNGTPAARAAQGRRHPRLLQRKTLGFPLMKGFKNQGCSLHGAARSE